MLNSKKAPEIVLDQDIASKILENVFQDNQVEPNSIPLEVLTSYSNYRKERFALQRTILIIMMVLCLITKCMTVKILCSLLHFMRAQHFYLLVHALVACVVM